MPLMGKNIRLRLLILDICLFIAYFLTTVNFSDIFFFPGKFWSAHIKSITSYGMLLFNTKQRKLFFLRWFTIRMFNKFRILLVSFSYLKIQKKKDFHELIKLFYFIECFVFWWIKKNLNIFKIYLNAIPYIPYFI